jgi:L-fuculose-phosphate aldolase
MAQRLEVVRQVEKEPLEIRQRREICNIGRSLYRRGFVVACEGNLSIRIGNDRILVTPAGACKGLLAPGDLLVTDLDGLVVSGTGRPSSEMQMHLRVYRSRPEVGAVCHAHPPIATGFAAAGRALEEAVLPEVVMDLGTIPLAPYGTPGTMELSAGLQSLVPNHDAILLANHGVVTCAQDLVTAYYRMETVEHFAHVLWTAETLGGPHLLPRAEVRKLLGGRPQSASCAPGAGNMPRTSESSGERITLTMSELESLLVAAVQRRRAH